MIVVLDKDPRVCRRLRTLGNEQHVTIEACSNLKELRSFAGQKNIDVLIVDYTYKTERMFSSLNYWLEQVPIVFVGKNCGWSGKHEKWPNQTQRFIHQNFGFDQVLEVALNLQQNANTNTEVNYMAL